MSYEASKREDEPTWTDLVLELKPDATGEEIDYLLWECTGFPLASDDEVRQQLCEALRLPYVPQDARSAAYLSTDTNEPESGGETK